MKTMFILLLLMTFNANANELNLGLRFGSVPSSEPGNILGFVPDTSGKLAEVVADYDVFKSFYVELANGIRSNEDVRPISSHVTELSPGVHIKPFPFMKIWASQGIAYFSDSAVSRLYPTHIGISLIESSTGTSMGIERSHYSDSIGGSTHYDYVGLNITFRIFE